tara:strand:- start:75 stop:329 length:255 start_codon:yes stop_codon:yes gene_type:complete
MSDRNADDIRKLQTEQTAIETRLFKLRDTVRDMEEEINNINIYLDITKAKLKSFDGIIGWIVKLFIGAILGGLLTFIIKGGLVL